MNFTALMVLSIVLSVFFGFILDSIFLCKNVETCFSSTVARERQSITANTYFSALLRLLEKRNGKCAFMVASAGLKAKS